MTTFSQYIEGLCREHALIKHTDNECHFSDLTSDFENKLKRLMHFPCVSIDTDGFLFTGTPGNKWMRDKYNIYFLEHIRDAGNYMEVMAAFARTRNLMLDFLRRMERDRKACIQPMSLPSTDGRSVSLYLHHLMMFFAMKISTHKAWPQNLNFYSKRR